MYVYLNGLIKKDTDASISVYDQGFTHAYSVFETLRVYNGKPFLLDPHVSRLMQGCNTIDIPLQYTDFNSIIADLVRRNAIRDGVARIQITRGVGPSDQKPAHPTVLVTVKPLNLPSEYATGVSCATYQRLAPHQGVKSTDYLFALLSKDRAQKEGFNDVIFFDENKNICEASMASVFIVKGGVLLTPPLTQGILPSITRAYVISLARQHQIPLEERTVSKLELISADEVFMCASVREIVPVTKVNSIVIGNGAAGTMTKQLMDLYKKEVYSILSAHP